jgi:hypothetical protein
LLKFGIICIADELIPRGAKMDAIFIPISAYEKAYDNSLYNQDPYSMYDNLPYVSNKEICNKENLKLFSGNVIKYYRCLMKEPYEIKH